MDEKVTPVCPDNTAFSACTGEPDPSQASASKKDRRCAGAVTEYYYLTSKIEERLQAYLAIHAVPQGTRCVHRTAA